jgi:hypothetical protein
MFKERKLMKADGFVPALHVNKPPLGVKVELVCTTLGAIGTGTTPPLAKMKVNLRLQEIHSRTSKDRGEHGERVHFKRIMKAQESCGSARRSRALRCWQCPK